MDRFLELNINSDTQYMSDTNKIKMEMKGKLLKVGWENANKLGTNVLPTSSARAFETVVS